MLRGAALRQNTKRGFREKLLETLSNAQEVSHGVSETDAPTKQSILIECLVSGNCQTFVDLFYMTSPEARPSDEELIAKGIGALPIAARQRASAAGPYLARRPS